MQDKWGNAFFIVLLALVTLLFIYLLRPFISVLFWATIISLVFYPVYWRIVHHCKFPPNLAALCSLLLCVVVVLLPLYFISGAFIEEGTMLYAKIESGDINPAAYVEQLRQAFPRLQEILAPFALTLEDIKARISNGLLSIGGILARNAVAWGGGTLQIFVDLCLMLYISFFMMRDGHSMVELLVRALPIGDARERLLLGKFAEVTRATIKGSLVVAVVQGALGGLIFWILGIRGPLLWGVVMAVLALLPVVGSGLVWLPAAIFLILGDEAVKGVVLIVFGVGVIGLVDNVLRPFLVGRDTKLPDYMVLLSTLGGFMLFGASGFVAGPLVAVLFLSVWDIFMHEISEKGEPRGSDTGKPDLSSPARHEENTIPAMQGDPPAGAS